MFTINIFHFWNCLRGTFAGWFWRREKKKSKTNFLDFKPKRKMAQLVLFFHFYFFISNWVFIDKIWLYFFLCFQFGQKYFTWLTESSSLNDGLPSKCCQYLWQAILKYYAGSLSRPCLKEKLSKPWHRSDGEAIWSPQPRKPLSVRNPWPHRISQKKKKNMYNANRLKKLCLLGKLDSFILKSYDGHTWTAAIISITIGSVHSCFGLPT